MEKEIINRYNWKIADGDYISELGSDRIAEEENRRKRLKKYLNIGFTLAAFVVIYILAAGIYK